MGKRQLKRDLAGRMRFVGCQFCGETDRPLRNYCGGKICPACLAKRKVSDLGTRKE